MTRLDSFARIADPLGVPLPCGMDDLAAAAERLAANLTARERLHRRTLAQLRATEREIDALRAGGGR